VRTLRGIIVHQHGAGTTASIEVRSALIDLHGKRWRGMWDCGLWGRAIMCRNEKSINVAGASELCLIHDAAPEKVFLKALNGFCSEVGRILKSTKSWAL